MTYKILKRTADFNVNAKDDIPILQSKPIPLPKRSKLFLEQSLRERNAAGEMHQLFQQDIIRLRLTNASELVNSITELQNEEDLKVEAQVQGLGPNFILLMSLENLSSGKYLKELNVTVHAKPLHYVIHPCNIKIAIVPPSCRYRMRFHVKSLFSKDQPSSIDMNPFLRIYISKFSKVEPELAFTVNLPKSEIDTF